MRMCAAEVLFSLTPICHFLPPYIPPLSTERSFLYPAASFWGSSITIRNGPRLHRVPQQHPGGMIDSLQLWSWIWTLSKMHVVKMIGIKQKHMVCLLQAELNTDGYLCAVIWVNEHVKPEFGHSSFWEMKMKSEQISLCFSCFLLSCLCTPWLWYISAKWWAYMRLRQHCVQCAVSHRQQIWQGLYFACVHFNSASLPR